MQTNKMRIGMLLVAMIGLFPCMPAQAQQLDPVLQELINKGLNKSHSINVHEYKGQQAKLDERLAKSVFIPKLTLNGSFTRLDDDITFGDDTQGLLKATQKLLIKEAMGVPFNAELPANVPLEPIPNLQDKNILKTSLDLDWVLFSGFVARNAVQASQHKEASMDYLTEVEKEKLVLDIMENYDQLALVNASKEVLSVSQKYLDKQKRYVNKAIENGFATPIDRKRIELAQQQLAGKLLEFRHNKTLLVEVLHQLTNDNKKHLSVLNPELQPLLIDLQSESKKRNEIKALEEVEQATLHKAKMDRNNLIPKVAIKGHYEFLEDDLSLLDPKWFVGIGVKWNLFDGLHSNLKRQQSKLESLQYGERKAEAEEKIALSIINAELTYESSLQNIKMVRKETEIAKDTYEMLNKQYQNNLASLNEVIDALNELEKADFKLQESYFKQRRAATELLHAKGLLNY